MYAVGVNKFSAIFNKYKVKIYTNPCIEYDLFHNKKLLFIGDASVATSYRLGHIYWSIKKQMEAFVPQRSHQNDPSVKISKQ